MSLFIKGIYRDVLVDSHGRSKWDSGWRSNVVVQNCSLLLAALMKRHQGMQGILFWAIGEGKKDWDSRCPSPLPTDSHLFSEIARQALTEDQIIYLDPANKPQETPSNILEISAEFRGEDIIIDGFRPLREFGLFGGDATEEPDTGLMIDYVIHPRIDMYKEMNLLRSVYLTFSAITNY